MAYRCSSSSDALNAAKASFERAQAAFLDSGNCDNDQVQRTFGAAAGIYKAKFDAFLDGGPHAPALRWYEQTATTLASRLMWFVSRGVHPYSPEAANETWQLMGSWERMEKEVSSLGYRTVPMEELLAAGCNWRSKQHKSIYHLVGVERDADEYPVLHASKWKSNTEARADHTEELVALVKKFATTK